MQSPTIRGLIDRRVLVNFLVDPDVLSRVCPSPFRPRTVNGFGIAGICLLRLKHIRPKRLPSFLGISSENAAHRIAVQWDANGVTHNGVYIPRRDTSSFLNAFVGGRLFSSVHHRAKFDVRETQSEYHIAIDSVDNATHIVVKGHATYEWPSDSVFETLAQYSQFFEAGSVGYSPASSTSRFHGLELQTFDWRAQPLDITNVQSSFFDDREVFPDGSITFDNAILMRKIDHQWHSRESFGCVGG